MDLSETKLNPTKDIELRVPTKQELTILAQEVLDPKNAEYILKYTGYAKGLKSPEEYLEKRLLPKLESTKKGEELILLIFHKGHLAGRISTHNIDHKSKKTEFGYFLLQGSTGKGIMRQCISALEKFVFGELDINRIELCIDPDNTSSLSLARELGYVHEGTLRQSYFNEYIGELRDDMIFSKLKSEFEKNT